MNRLLILNPNSSQEMTEGIARTVGRLFSPEFRPEVRRVRSSPPSLETFYEYELAAAGAIAELRRLGLTHDAPRAHGAPAQTHGAPVRAADYKGVLLACFGDPGLWALKESCRVPVIGIAEAAMSTALLLGYRFALLVALPRAVPMMDAMLRMYSLRERCSGIYPLSLPVLALESAEETLARAVAAGTQAVHDGAEVLILGCAGLTGRDGELQEQLGVPVIDPIRAGYFALEGLVRAGFAHSKAGMFAFPQLKSREES